MDSCDKKQEAGEENDSDLRQSGWVQGDPDGGKSDRRQSRGRDKTDSECVTMHGRTLKRSEKVNSCGVSDGCTIQVTNRMRGGGRHKDKKGKAEKKQATSAKTPEQKFTDEEQGDRGPAIRECDKDAVVRMIEETEGYRKRVEMISEGSDEEYRMQCFKAELHEKSGLDEDQMKGLECGIIWALQARRKGRDEEQEQRRRGEQEQLRQDEQGQNTEQEQSKQGKQVEEEQLEETRAENSGEPEVTGRTTEVRTGRGSAGIVRGRDERRRADETSKKGKGKGNGGKGEHERRGRERRNGSEWRRTWDLVAHTPRPCRIRERER